MLRTNLSTRPFYNERVVHLILALVAILVVAVTVFNASRIVVLSRRHTELRAQIGRDEARAAELAQQAAGVSRGMDAQELEAVVAAAGEVNALIDQRTFSWTELFNRIESTLPPDIMLSSIRPQIERGVVTLTLTVLARRVDAIDTFIERLEATGAFQGVLARQEERTEAGQYRAVLRGRYVAAPPPEAGSAGDDTVAEP